MANLCKLLLLLSIITMSVFADEDSYHFLDCISACDDPTNVGNQRTCLQCYWNPPIVDVLCIFACGHADPHFLLKGICQKCLHSPPCTEHLSEMACSDSHPELGNLCEACLEQYEPFPSVVKR